MYSYVSRLEYAQQMMPIGINDVIPADSTLEMSPMDLFDSIFWGQCALCAPSGGILTVYRYVPDERFGSAWVRLLAANVSTDVLDLCSGVSLALSQRFPKRKGGN